MNKKAVLLLIHIPVWIVAIFFVLLIQFSGDQVIRQTCFTISESIIISAWFLGSFYLFYSILVPRYLENRKITPFLLISFVFITLMPFCVNFLVTLNRIIFGIPTPSRLTIWGYLGGIFGSFTAGGLGAFYRFGTDWFKNIQLKKDLEYKNLQSELKTLKSKLNPHLLFNTLNNIDALIQTDPVQASHALSKLSDLLRYVVYDTELPVVSIKKEIENLQKYVELEKIRLLFPDSVSFTSSLTNDLLIPPMIFFPFVENGFKHSNLNDPDHKLTISVSEEKNKIVFRCVNTINDKKQNDVNSGLGLELAEKRLDLLFPGSHILNITKTDKEFHVYLEIDIKI